MDRETIKRVKGDFNQTSISMKMNSLLSQDQQGTNQSYLLRQEQTEKTFSLTMLFNNIIDLNLQEIIAFYDFIDKNLFDHSIKASMILGEYNQYDDISQLENQRIVLHYYKSSTVLAGYIPDTQKLIVIKQLFISSQETFIYMLDEYKIHYKINKLFPQESLELIIPVKLQKTQKTFEISAIMERAEFNLYEYSRNHKINEKEALNIFVQILDQIINLHSVNVAHRDIKPQNIFYVKNKGWLLSDFGESLEYDEVDGLYNIRGTRYFLLPALQQNIYKNNKINQNLIYNDLYALVATIVMIQNQQYINDMHEQILNLKDDLLKQVLKLGTLEQLQQYRAKLNFQKDKNLIDLTNSCQKQLSEEEQVINQTSNFISQIQYLQRQIREKADQTWIEKLIQLIRKNIRFILQRFGNVVGFALLNLSQFLKIDLKLELDRKYIKNIKNKPPNQQEFYIQMLFLYGYTEKTINLAIEFLKSNYSQAIHLVLIDSYQRANMFEEAGQQLKQFTEGLVFDQLNTSSQIQYLYYLQYFYGEQSKHNICFDFNPEKELLERGHQLSGDYLQEFKQQIQQFSPDYYLNRGKIVKVFLDRIDEMCIDFCIINMPFCREAFKIALDQPLYILLPVIKKIYQQNYGQFDSNRKLTFLLEIAELLLLLDDKKEFMQNLKLIKQSVFYSESCDQTISFQIAQLSTVIMEYILQYDHSKINIDLQMEKLVNILKRISKIQFKGYHQYILGTLWNLLKIIQNHGIIVQNRYLVFVVQFIINYTVDQDYHINNYENFPLFHIYAQCVLIDIKNYKRCQQNVQKQKRFLNHKATQVIKQKKFDPLNLLIKPSIKNLLKIEIVGRKEIQQIVSKQFLFNRYFFV